MFEGLFGDDPKPTQVGLDPQTQALISAGLKQGQQTPDQVAGHLNEGVNQSGHQAMQSDQSLQQEAASTGQDPSMLAAIRNQFNKSAQGSINSVINQNQMNSRVEKAHLLNQYAGAITAQQRIETQNFEQLTQANMNAEIARAQVLQSVFSAAGTGIGMYYGQQQARKHPFSSTSVGVGQQPSFGMNQFSMPSMGPPE